MNEWPRVQRMVGSAISSATEYYILNGDLPFRPTEGYYLALWRLAPAVFGQRLSICWNTYWQAGLVPTFQAGGLPASGRSSNGSGSSGSGNRGSSGEEVDYAAAAATGAVVLPANGGFRVNATTARMLRLTPRYVCRAPWLALLIAASSALLLSGVAGLVAKHTAGAPDVLAYVSSLTRDNPHIPLGAGDNTLDGMERARALKNLRVRLRDVRPDAAVGHIALAPDGATVSSSVEREAAAELLLPSRDVRGSVSLSPQRARTAIKKDRLYA
jgi:hypothetical protein